MGEATWVPQTFEHCLHKLARAREHISLLRELGQRWVGGLEGAVVVVPKEDDPTRWEYRLGGSLPPPPPMIAVVFSDVLAQMRSALDHLAAFLVATGAKPDRVRDAYFPVCLSEDSWPRAVRTKLPGVTDSALLGVVRGAQPFVVPFWLAHLAALSNADKHRHLLPHAHVATSTPRLFDYGAWEDPQIVSVRPVLSEFDILQPGEVLAEVTMSRPGVRPPLVDVSTTMTLIFTTVQDSKMWTMAVADMRHVAGRIEDLTRQLAGLTGHPVAG